MTRARSPHEVLALPPGADRSAVEAAYRRLIKLHHPDRAGGDAETAKAIIKAYRQLIRAGERLPVTLQAPPAEPRKRIRWRKWALAGALGAMLWWAPWAQLDWPLQAVPPDLNPRQAAVPVVPSVQARVAPDAASVEAGVSEAERLDRQSVEAVVGYGQSCAADLARLPGDGLLDHCLAFDVAAAHGRAAPAAWLSAEAMGKRHAAAAGRVLGDPVLAKARVREVRRLVERQLLER